MPFQTLTSIVPLNVARSLSSLWGKGEAVGGEQSAEGALRLHIGRENEDLPIRTEHTGDPARERQDQVA